MLKSMTGYGSRAASIVPFGKISVELRSTNHKFLEVVFHLPEGFLSLEEKIKKEIEDKLKRGRVVCAVTLIGTGAKKVFVNRDILRGYIGSLRQIKKEFGIRDNLSLETLVSLPGVLSLWEPDTAKAEIWPQLKRLVFAAVNDLMHMRQREGTALAGYLKTKTQALRRDLAAIRARFQKVSRQKAAKIENEEERTAFLKNSDITEEIERLSFHIRNFAQKLRQDRPIGKELDFIAQEMQREANTMGAKSCDIWISGRVVQLKSQVEKIREQTQNIE